MMKDNVMLVVKKEELDLIMNELTSLRELLIKKVTDDQKPMSIKQLMAYLGKSRTSIFRYMRNYDMPFHKLGPDPVFYAHEIDEWIKTSTSVLNSKPKKIH